MAEKRGVTKAAIEEEDVLPVVCGIGGTINRSFSDREDAVASLGALSARFDALHHRLGVACLRPGSIFLTREAFGRLFSRYSVQTGGPPEAPLILCARAGGARFIAYTDHLDVGESDGT